MSYCIGVASALILSFSSGIFYSKGAEIKSFFCIFSYFFFLRKRLDSPLVYYKEKFFVSR